MLTPIKCEWKWHVSLPGQSIWEVDVLLCVYFPLSTGLKQMTKSLGGKKLSPWKPLITLIGWLDEWEISFYWVKPLRLWEIVGSITITVLPVLLIQLAWQTPPSHAVLSGWTKKQNWRKDFSWHWYERLKQRNLGLRRPNPEGPAWRILCWWRVWCECV